MNRNKYSAHSAYTRRMPKRILRRGQQGHLTALLVSLLLIIGIGIGGTMAYVLTQTEKTENIFTPGKVACEVTENFTNGVKSNVAVKNTGNTDAYIRAAINVTWMPDNTDPANQTVAAKVPQKDTDYTIKFADNSGWIEGSDGYWYYQTPVAPGSSTEKLIDRCELATGAEVPQGYYLSVEIISSAIQSSPAAVVAEKWHVTLEHNRIVGANGSEVTGE